MTWEKMQVLRFVILYMHERVIMQQRNLPKHTNDDTEQHFNHQSL